MYSRLHTINQKLTFLTMTTCVTSFIIAGIALMVFQMINLRDQITFDLTIQAKMLANASVYSLEFQEEKDAQKILNELKEDPTISYAAIYNKKWQLFTSYLSKTNTNHIPPKNIDHGHSFTSNSLQMVQPIILQEELIGKIYIEKDLMGMYKVIRQQILAIVVIMLLSSTLAYFLSKKLQPIISGPILSLTDITTTISKKNDYSLRVDKRNYEGEMGVLIDGFNYMLDQIESRDGDLVKERDKAEKISIELAKHRDQLADLVAALQISEARFQTLAQESPVGIFQADLSGKFIFINPQFKHILGTKSSSSFSDMWISFLHADDRTHVLKAWNTAIKNQVNFKSQFRFCSTTGKDCWVIGQAAVTRDISNQVNGFVGTFTDITGLKDGEEKIRKSLREKEMLLKEVHHRVKNNLQVISSLLRLQSNRITDETYRGLFMESQARVETMALIHEKLYKSNDLGRIDFSEYGNSLIQGLSQSYRIQPGIAVDFKIEIDNINLNIETAIPCGLIINELISNSLKHAFPTASQISDTKPEIYVKLSMGDEGRFHLCIGDNGVGMSEEIDINHLDSLGLRIVQGLTKQLDGKSKFSFNDGFKYDNEFDEIKYTDREWQT